MYSLKLATRRGMRYEYYRKCLFLAWLGVGFVCADFRNIFCKQKWIHCLAKANPTPFISKQISLKRWDEKSSTRREQRATLGELSKAEYPPNEILSPFSNAKCHWTNFQVVGKIVFVCNFCLTSAQMPAFRWVHTGGFRALTRSSNECGWVGAKKFDPCSTSFLLELEGVWPKVKTIQLSPPRGGERSRSASPHNCGYRREGALATRGRVDLVGLLRGQVLEPSRHVGRTHPEVVEGGRGQPLPRDVLRKGFHHARLLGEQV